MDRRINECIQALREILDKAASITTPEVRVNEAYRAWIVQQVLCIDRVGGVLEAHDGCGFYEQVYGQSGSVAAEALASIGLFDVAKGILDGFIARQSPEGLLRGSYDAAPDHGVCLWAICRTYLLSGDGEWWRRVEPAVRRAAAWIVGARRRGAGEPDVVRGLLGPMRSYADHAEPVQGYFADAWNAVALADAARILEDESLARTAAEYRTDILASMDGAAFRLEDGTTVLPMEPLTRRLCGSGHAGDYYGLIASMMIESGFLEPPDHRFKWVIDFMRGKGGLTLGLCRFADGIDHAYTGGYAWVMARAGEVERALLSFYATLAYGMSRDTYSGVEVTRIATGENHPTLPHLYSGTEQIRMLRNLLVLEEQDSLHIGRCAPRSWLNPGAGWSVEGMPTAFGKVSVWIEPTPEGVRARIERPERFPSGGVFLYLRHPWGQDRTITIPEGKGPVVIEESFQ